MFYLSLSRTLLPLPLSEVKDRKGGKSLRRVFFTWNNYPDLLALHTNEQEAEAESKEQLATDASSPTALATATSTAPQLQAQPQQPAASSQPHSAATSTAPAASSQQPALSPEAMLLLDEVDPLDSSDLVPTSASLWHDYFASIPGIKGFVVGFEVGESGTPHLQGTLLFDSQKTFKFLSRYLYKSHLEEVRDLKKSVLYCRKEGNVVEGGEVPQFSDHDNKSETYSDLMQMVLSGASIREMATDFPYLMLRNVRNVVDLKKALKSEDLAEELLRKSFPDRQDLDD